MSVTVCKRSSSNLLCVGAQCLCVETRRLTRCKCKIEYVYSPQGPFVSPILCTILVGQRGTVVSASDS